MPNKVLAKKVQTEHITASHLPRCHLSAKTGHIKKALFINLLGRANLSIQKRFQRNRTRYVKSFYLTHSKYILSVHIFILFFYEMSI